MRNPLAEDLEHVLSHAASVWDELAGARLFITGGTGFFGCWMLETLLWANHRRRLNISATVLTRGPGAFTQKAPHLVGNPAVQLIDGDVRSFQFPPGEYSHILHLAASTDARNYDKDPIGMLDTIVSGTRRVLDFAVASRARNFLLASSGAVYGRQPDDLERVPETYCGGPDPTRCQSTYAEGKRTAEMLGCLYLERHGVAVKLARGFAFVGPYMPLDQHFAIGNFIADALARRPIVIKGDGTPMRSYLYAADMAAWLWTILLRGKPGRAYNVGSSESVSISQLAATISQTLGSSAGIQVLGGPEAGHPRERYVPSADRAQIELGLEVWIGIEEAIRRTAAWFEAKRCAGSP